MFVQGAGGSGGAFQLPQFDLRAARGAKIGDRPGVFLFDLLLLAACDSQIALVGLVETLQFFVDRAPDADQLAAEIDDGEMIGAVARRVFGFPIEEGEIACA